MIKIEGLVVKLRFPWLMFISIYILFFGVFYAIVNATFHDNLPIVAMIDSLPFTMLLLWAVT